MSLSEKLIDVNLASVSKSNELGKELLLLRGVHLEAKKLIKVISFFKKSVSNLFSISIGGIIGTFLVL